MNDQETGGDAPYPFDAKQEPEQTTKFRVIYDNPIHLPLNNSYLLGEHIDNSFLNFKEQRFIFQDPLLFL